MAFKADSTGSVQSIITDGITSPVAGDVQVVELGSVAAGVLAAISAANPLPVRPVSGTAVITAVAVSSTTVVLKAANAARVGLTIYNDAGADLYVALAGTATLAAFTIRLGNGSGGGYYEVPAGYTGVVSGIWAAATGNGAKVTELTA